MYTYMHMLTYNVCTHTFACTHTIFVHTHICSGLQEKWWRLACGGYCTTSVKPRVCSYNTPDGETHPFHDSGKMSLPFIC